MKDPRTIASKWKQRAGAASGDWLKGVQSVTEAPGQKAAAQEDKMLQNFTEAITSGRWRNAVSAVTLQMWQQACADKGKQNYQTGIAASEEKYFQAMQKMMPIIESIKQSLPPKGDIEQNIARSAEFQRRMNEAKKAGQLS